MPTSLTRKKYEQKIFGQRFYNNRCGIHSYIIRGRITTSLIY
jgi:hypothetical protein